MSMITIKKLPVVRNGVAYSGRQMLNTNDKRARENGEDKVSFRKMCRSTGVFRCDEDGGFFPSWIPEPSDQKVASLLINNPELCDLLREPWTLTPEQLRAIASIFQSDSQPDSWSRNSSLSPSCSLSGSLSRSPSEHSTSSSPSKDKSFSSNEDDCTQSAKRQALAKAIRETMSDILQMYKIELGWVPLSPEQKRDAFVKAVWHVLSKTPIDLTADDSDMVRAIARLYHKDPMASEFCLMCRDVENDFLPRKKKCTGDKTTHDDDDDVARGPENTETITFDTGDMQCENNAPECPDPTGQTEFAFKDAAPKKDLVFVNVMPDHFRKHKTYDDIMNTKEFCQLIEPDSVFPVDQNTEATECQAQSKGRSCKSCNKIHFIPRKQICDECQTKSKGRRCKSCNKVHFTPRKQICDDCRDKTKNKKKKNKRNLTAFQALHAAYDSESDENISNEV